MSTSDTYKFKISASKVLLLIVIVLLSLIYSNQAFSQTVGIRNMYSDTTAKVVDSSLAISDSSLLSTVDSSTLDSTTSPNTVPISPDALDRVVKFTVPDSVILNNRTKRSYFYGVNVIVETEDLKLEAPMVVYNSDSSTMSAYNRSTDSTNKSTFSQGQESFGFEEIAYNFDTKKALVTNAKSKYDEGYIYSDRIKRNPDETIYGLHNKYTTCSADDPHFAIVSNKIKIIPNRVVVSGPARLEIAGIPTPLILPFALFPLSKGQKSGFILPTYDLSGNQGIGLKGMGYYLAINDYMDLKLTGSIYSLGTWAASASTAYIKKYRYQGNFGLSLANNVFGDRYSEDYQEARTFSINWNHSINPNLLRGYNFGANVNFTSPSYYRLNSYNNNLALQNSTNSNISLSKSWKGTPFNFSLNMRHSQNNATQELEFLLPNLVFNMSQQYPFKKKISGAEPKWYEKIGVGYTMSANNSLSYNDTVVNFADNTTYKLQNGIRHDIPIQANYKVLKFLNFTTRFNYQEYWNSKKTTIRLDETTNTRDTLIESGFYASRYFSSGIGVNAIIYGLFKFKSKYLKAIRHQMTPSISMDFTPDFSAARWNSFYFTKLDTASTQETALSYYINNYGSNYGQLGNQRSIQFALNNNVEMKIRDKNDSSGFKKSALIDQFNLNTSYNFIADSFKLAPLTISYNTRILKQIGVQGGLSYTPYETDTATGRLIDEYLWNIRPGKILRLQQMSIGLTGQLNSKMLEGKGDNEKYRESEYLYTDYLSEFVDFEIPWSLGINFSYSLINQLIKEGGDAYFKLKKTSSVNLNGDFNMTPRWKFGYSLNYDFTLKKLNYTTLDIYRDLHCWELHIQTIPFGIRRSFNITLNVKAAVLQDLRINRQRSFIDNF